MTTNTRFWDRIADKYAAQPVPDAAAYQQKLARTREYLEPSMRLLEFGCGTGSTALEHAPHVADILATDLSPRMIEIARSRAAAKGIENVAFEVGTLETIEAAPGSFDAVLGLSILHLVADRDSAIRRVFELLRPGGVFVSNTACLEGVLRIFKVIGPAGRALGLLPDLQVFSSDELQASLRAAGFSIEHYWRPKKNSAVFIIARKPG